MTDDFRVKALSNANVRKLAKRLRVYFGVADARRIDVLECAKKPSIWTVNGERALTLNLRPDDEMPDAHGLTTEIDGLITIRARRSVHHGAFMGDGRDRNTFAHELGHAALG